MRNKKFYKLLFGNKSYASGEAFEYKINELLEYNEFNADPSLRGGGFFVSSVEVLLRSLVRGTTLYDVDFPDDTIIVNVPSEYIRNGRYKVNKIKLSNPRLVTDNMALELLKETKVVDEVWADIVAIVSIYGYMKTAKKIIQDHINNKNIDRAIEKTNEFLAMGDGFGYGHIGVNESSMKEVLKLLNLKKDNI